MGLFSRDNNAGPGVSKETPRKKGVPRFFEIIIREYRDLMKVNILFFICALPSTTLFFLGLFDIFEFALILSVAAAFPIGGAAAASMFCITRMLRDDPGFLWDDFKRKFLENLRQASIAGMFAATFLFTQVFLFWLPVMADWEDVSIAWLIAMFALIIFFLMILPYIFLHYAYIKLGTFTIVKNSTFIALSNLGRSFMGAVTGLLPWFVLFFFFPLSLVFFPLIPFFVFVLSWLLTLLWVWPVFDRRFSIEETLRMKREEQ